MVCSRWSASVLSVARASSGLLVATVPRAQGRGLGAELMRHGLRQARAAGAVTTGLESSSRGEGVYARLGYRRLGRFGLWELRQA